MQSAEITLLHSRLGDRVRLCLEKRKMQISEPTGLTFYKINFTTTKFNIYLERKTGQTPS